MAKAPIQDISQKGGTMETWAYCGGCERWFYVPIDLRDEPSPVACPACERPPVRLTTMPEASRV